MGQFTRISQPNTKVVAVRIYLFELEKIAKLMAKWQCNQSEALRSLLANGLEVEEMQERLDKAKESEDALTDLPH